MDNAIAELHFEGYRSLRNVTLRPGRLNVLIGPNASGKSNLLKALSLVAASARARLQDFIDEDGGMGSILWNGSGTAVRCRVTFDETAGSESERALEYALDLHRISNWASYRIVTERLAWLRRGHGGKSDEVLRIFINGQAGEPEYDDGRGIVPIPTNPDWTGVESILSHFIRPAESTPEINLCQSLMRSLAVYDRLWFAPKSEARQAVTARHAEQLHPDAGNLSSVLHTLYSSNTDFREDVDDAMFAAFRDEYRGLVFPPTGGQTQIQMAVQWRSIKDPVTTTSLSDGTLRFLAIITALAQPNLPALIAIDEPETGLHPRMMSIIAAYARNTALRSQILFTTHSAAFLDAFNSDEPPTTAIAELVDGATQIRTLDPDELRRWLASYTLGDLYDSMQLEQIPVMQVVGE